MPDVAVQVDTLANAYRSAMDEGDKKFAERPVERKILQPILAASAADNLSWVQTRLPNGQAIGKPLAELAPALSKGDHVGQSLRAVETKVFGVAKSVVISLVTTAAWPVWLVGAAAFFAGILINVQNVGFNAGKTLAVVAVGGGAAFGALVRAAQASPTLARSIGGAAGSLLDQTERIGGEAEGVFKTAVGPSLTALHTGHAPPIAAAPVVGRLRGWSKAIVLVSYAVLAIGLLVFAVGVYHGFKQGIAPPPPCLRKIADVCVD
jgi:hypothetical protein